MAYATDQREKPQASSRILMSAKKLQSHIRACGLQPGDRYISAKEAGRILGESTMTAQRTMTYMAKLSLLERRPKAGTFIGPAMAAKLAASCIHFLLPEYCLAQGELRQGFWPQIKGLRSVLPDASAQFNFIPQQNLAYVLQVVEQASETGSLMGVVLVLSSREIRHYFNQSGIPTVVSGSVEPDLANLCWLDWDQAQIGRLLTDYLLRRGHRRLATIMRNIWAVGEHMLHDGISEVLAEAGLPSNALLVRSAPAEQAVITEMVHGLLTQTPEPPTGFICRTSFQADCVSQVVRSLGVADRVDVVLCNAPNQTDQCKYTCAFPEIGMFEEGRLMGKMFLGLTRGQPPEPRGQYIAVKLHPVLEKLL